MKMIFAFIIVICGIRCSNHQNNIELFNTLKAEDLIGKWGESDEHAGSFVYIKPVWEIKNNSFCFIATSSCFDFRIKDNNLTVYSMEPIIKLQKVSLIKDTLTYFDYNDSMQKMYRVK